MTSSTSTAATAQAHGRFIRGSVSKVRRVLDQIRGRTYRDALIMLEFMPYRSTGPITKVLRSAVANAENNLGLDPASLVISSASADMGPSHEAVPASGPRPGLPDQEADLPHQHCCGSSDRLLTPGL